MGDFIKKIKRGASFIPYLLSTKSAFFINEQIKDSIPREYCIALRKKAGGYWRIVIPKKWRFINDIKEFPALGKAKIVDKNKKIIGQVTWKTSFYVANESDEFWGGIKERVVNAKPINIKIKL